MEKKEAYTFTSDDAKNYDDYLGPVLFEPYGKYLASHIDTANLSSVLELAGGTGRVTGYLRKALPPGTKLWATDISPDMLNIAKQKLGTDGITYAAEDIQNLSFADNTFDLVVCQFGMMFLPDKQKGFNEICRVLKPGGKLMCLTWDSTLKNPLFGLLINKLMLPHFEGEDTTRFFVPFSLHNPQQLAAWMQNAGFKSVNTDIIGLNSGPVTAEHIETGFYKVHPLGRAMAEKGETADATVGQQFRRQVEEQYGTRVSFPMSALLTVGIK
jgi:ubiquinone/menaquinone biosynthesis C-methylase UbiE